MEGIAETLKIWGATLEFEGETIWRDLNLEVAPGEFIAIIGSNGSGKTSLLKAIIGQNQLTAGTIERDDAMAYIPQSRGVESNLKLRVRDLVGFGFDGQRWLGWLHAGKRRKVVNAALAAIGLAEKANQSVAGLSGGEFQRVRIGQAMVSHPRLILADEPLSALDLKQQKSVVETLNRMRVEHGASVLFVTHDVNPILDVVDRVLYLANGGFRIGKPDEVLSSQVLSELYQTPVDVVRNQGRIVVVGTTDHDHHHDEVWS
jgi:zinc/manganese transport system ATP-binding protein